MKKVKLFLLLMSFTVSVLTYAQVTTSSVSGRVTDGKETLIGATVKAVHEPSGTTYGAVTNSEGRYTIQGMRTGGPYRVEVLYLGFADYVQSNVYLQLGQTYVLDAQLSETAQSLDEIVVTGLATKFTTEKTGASTNVNNEQIRLLPTINRSINDFARLSPYASSGNSFAGRDGRSNNFTVDGARLNNSFGLSSDLPGGGNPISIDAIEELQVVIAPYDVRQSNFIGGGINAITKSGTNTVKGSVYSYFHNQNLRGNTIGDFTPEGDRPKEGKTIYGATLGGPIIKDKLFFFGNFEYESSPEQISDWRASADGVANGDNFISHARQSDMDEFSRLLKERYGYDTGSSTDFPGGVSNLKFLGRIDWNINQAHKLSLRYNYTKNDDWVEPNGNSADTGYRLNGTARIGIDGMSFMNSTYSQGSIVKSFTAELNSHLNNAMSNQFLVTYTDINDQRGSKSSPFPHIDIMNGDDVAAAGLDPTNNANFKPYMTAGYELFTWNNGVANKVFSVTDNYTYYLGAHKLTAGLNYEYQSALNSYMRNGTGYYRFKSFSDFKNNAAPEAFALTYGYDGELSPAGRVVFGQLAAYVQDEWNIQDNLKLTAGLRLDNTFFLNDIMTNNEILNLDFGGKRVDTGQWPDAKFQFSPRIGFTWDILGDKTLKVRGGSGLFTGRIPLVFFTNMPQNSGMIQGASNQIYTNYYTSADQAVKDGLAKVGDVKSRNPLLDQMYANGKLMTDVNQMVDVLGLKKSISPEEGTLQSNMAGVDANFKMPQVWKSSLGVDYEIPVSFPLTVTVEGMFTKYINDIRLANYNVKDQTAANGYAQFDGPDSRYIYPSNYQHYANTAAYDADHKKNVGVLGVLTNTSKGYGYTGNITIHATPVKDLDVMAAYTHTASYEVSGMPGSNATSAWQGLPTVNGPNFNGVQCSQYVTPNRFVASFNYHLSYLKDWTSSEIGVFYQGYSPYRYSYTYTNDMNGDALNLDLIYIPETKDEILWKTPEDANLFWAYLEKDSYLSAHKGEYADAYAAYAPMVHRFDLRFAQNFTVKVGKSKNTLQVSLDILNFGNLLKNTWGVNNEMIPAANQGKILRYEGVNKDGIAGNADDKVPYFSFFSQEEIKDIYTPFNDVTTQTWKLQIGVRYIFN
ncbi:MAG: carboxypeptidase regulatory-like domain-containing protein [Dysgonamonadaceae bacterium]|jgi:hypothetical protein|nr:carboxypeptidase regulatory-like domain-containing protein [Dysgonamonadaceae bacterium]